MHPLSRALVYCCYWVLLTAATTRGLSISRFLPGSYVWNQAAAIANWPSILQGKRPAASAVADCCCFSNSPISSSRGGIAVTELGMANTALLSMSRRLGKLAPSSTVFFSCDIQERFRDLIYNMPAVISTARYALHNLAVLTCQQNNGLTCS